MDQEKLELKVWKDLAVSKQILMRTASDALGLSPNCDADELKSALTLAIKRGNGADEAIDKARTETDNQVAMNQREVKNAEKALAEARKEIGTAETGRIEAENRVAVARKDNANKLKDLANQLTQKQKELKAINIALADTPENVIRKLKKLKKEKFDEWTACKRLEEEVRLLKKQNKQLEASIEEHKPEIEKRVELAEKYRALYALCKQQREELEPLVDDKSSLAELPAMDEYLSEGS